MDLGTIKERLQNNFYQTSKECIDDFKTMFNNCYKYNKSEHDVFEMAQQLEKVFNEKVALMPKDEIEIESRTSSENKEKASQSVRLNSIPPIAVASTSRDRSASSL